MDAISAAIIETIKNSTQVSRLEESLRLIRVADADYTSGIASHGGINEAPAGLIEVLGAATDEAMYVALRAAEELRDELEEITDQLGLEFTSSWGEGGDFAVWCSCRNPRQIAGFVR
jgi:hypothetical protein